MYRALLAAAILGSGALLTFAPAHAVPPQKSGVILAQWGGNGPPPWAGGGGGPPPWAGGGGGNCEHLQHRLQKLYMMREVASPWERPGVEQGIQETQAQLQYYCRGF